MNVCESLLIVSNHFLYYSVSVNLFGNILKVLVEIHSFHQTESKQVFSPPIIQADERKGPFVYSQLQLFAKQTGIDICQPQNSRWFQLIYNKQILRVECETTERMNKAHTTTSVF